MWLFALVMSVGFMVQEHAERFVASGEIRVEVAVEPTFVIGLLLQLASAIAAALVARAPLVSGEVIGRAFSEPRRRRFERTPRPATTTSSESLPWISVLALAHGQRAPPHRSAFG